MHAQSVVDDTTFGPNSGIVNTAYTYDEFRETLLQPDHKTILIGRRRLLRFNEDGSLDESFGVNGSSQFPDQFSLGISDVIINESNIYVSGYLYIIATGVQVPFIAKLDSNGNRVSGFGTDGVVTYSLNESGKFEKIVVTDSGQILALGIKSTNPWYKLFMVRFNSENGTVDTAFQNNGFREIYVFPVKTLEVVHLQPTADNQYFVFCRGLVNLGIDTPSTFAIIKINSDGDSVANFNNGQTYFDSTIGASSFKSFNNKTYIRKSTGLYTNDIMYKFDPYTLQYEGSLTVDFHTVDYYVKEDETIFTLSSGDPVNYITIPQMRNINISKYTINYEYDPSFMWTGIYEFNLSNINSYFTDDMGQNLFFYDNKMLVTGFARIPNNNGGATSYYTMRRFNLEVLSTDSVKESNFSIYPNPVKDVINVSSQNLVYPCKIEIYNMAGQIIKENYVESKNDIINIQQLASGLYLLKLSDDNGKEFNRKIIKE